MVKRDGNTTGTVDKSLRMEAIKISLGNSEEIPDGASISYQVHVQDYGWMNWCNNGEMAGTTGSSKRIEAIRIKLEGMEGYSVEYRAYVQDEGWQNGDMMGN